MLAAFESNPHTLNTQSKSSAQIAREWCAWQLETRILVLVSCCLMTPSLSKDIRCHV